MCTGVVNTGTIGPFNYYKKNEMEEAGIITHDARQCQRSQNLKTIMQIRASTQVIE
jgi:hypothetical protein